MKHESAGTRLRYCVLCPLGPTRFGEAHLALAKEEDSRQGFFTLEMLRADWARDDDLRALFLDEAAQTLSFEHPNVVRTQEVLLVPGACGRITRWFAGHTLADVLERVGRDRFPLQLHVRVLCEVLSALQYLHELEDRSGPSGGLLYRDLSPSQVLVTYTGQVKILGAGFERTINEIERRSGQLFSEVAYASPELCLGYPASASADVYSVGVMLWEALAQSRRVFANTVEESVRLRIDGEEPDVETVRPEAPRRLAQICGRALAVSPRDRYLSAQELQIDLESFLADTETEAQQNTGLGALAELMVTSFAAERAEMLGFIEQQLAEPEPSAEAGAAELAEPSPAAPPSLPSPAAAPMEPLDAPPVTEPAPLDAAAPARSEREPETNGHRAYSSTLRSTAVRPRNVARTALPIAIAAGVVLLLARSVYVTHGSELAEGTALAQPPAAIMQALTPVEGAEPVGALEVPAPAVPSAAPIAAQSNDAGMGAPPAVTEAVPESAALGAVSPELEPVAAPEAALLAAPEAMLPAAPGAVPPASEAAPPEASPPEASPPEASPLEASPLEATPAAAPEATLPVVSGAALPVVSEAAPAVQPVRPPPPRFRRKFKRTDSRAARTPGVPGVRPRVIDETDPYLE